MLTQNLKDDITWYQAKLHVFEQLKQHIESEITINKDLMVKAIDKLKSINEPKQLTIFDLSNKQILDLIKIVTKKIISPYQIDRTQERIIVSIGVGYEYTIYTDLSIFGSLNRIVDGVHVSDSLYIYNKGEFTSAIKAMLSISDTLPDIQIDISAAGITNKDLHDLSII